MQHPRMLAEIMDYWQEFGFEPWSWHTLQGIRRRVTFRKGSLLGEVASYYADDYIVWEHRGEEDARFLLSTWQPANDVVKHRFLLLGDDGVAEPVVKSFWFGFKGWLEILPYCIGSGDNKKFKDLIFLANKGWEFIQKQKDQL